MNLDHFNVVIITLAAVIAVAILSSWGYHSQLDNNRAHLHHRELQLQACHAIEDHIEKTLCLREVAQ